MKVKRIEIVYGQSQLHLISKGQPWWWHAVAGNGRKLGWSGEHYLKFADCYAAMQAVTGADDRFIPVYVSDRAHKRVQYFGKLVSGSGYELVADMLRYITRNVKAMAPSDKLAAEVKRTGQLKRAGKAASHKTPMRKQVVGGGVSERSFARRR